MIHLEKVKFHKQELIEKIKLLFEYYKIKFIFLTEEVPSTRVTEDEFSNNPIYETILIQKIYSTGIVEGIDATDDQKLCSWNLNELDIMTIAYILDELEKNI